MLFLILLDVSDGSDLFFDFHKIHSLLIINIKELPTDLDEQFSLNVVLPKVYFVAESN